MTTPHLYISHPPSLENILARAYNTQSIRSLYPTARLDRHPTVGQIVSAGQERLFNQSTIFSETQREAY